MARTATIAIALFAWSQVATAASWSTISFSTTAQSAPKVLEAADKVMASVVGQGFTGRLLLQANVADGDNPATHSFVPIYKTAAEREAFVRKLQADPVWTEFQKTMTKETQPVSVVLHRTLKRWGEIVDTDSVWLGHAFNVSDPGKFLAAIDKLMTSPTGQSFPGQVYLSEVIAGGISPVSHVISVGYASEAEMEAWFDVRDPSSDWAAYLDAANPVSEYLGANLSRNLKAWGTASLADVTAD